MTDNNGTLKQQDLYVPDDDQITTYKSWRDHFTYDNLNRLTQWNEYTYTGNPALDSQQAYILDRWGNRTIDVNNTSTNMPRPTFGVDTNTNRLTPATGYTMTYDAVGDLTYDNTHSGSADRVYDAESRMTKALENSQWQTYTYDATGKRVKRVANGTETWMVYGLGGELVAEYPANGAASSPQKEYAYRNGQLLLTAAPNQAQQSTENIVWTNAVNVSVSGNSISKTNADNWDAGADSTKSLISGDGYVEMTANETNKDRMFGWTHNEITASYTDLDFAIRPCDNGTIYVFESGANRGVVGSYVAGDKLRVSVESGVVKYYKTSSSTSTLLYTSSATPAYPLTADAAFYTSGGTISSAVISGNLSSGTVDLRWLVTDQLGTPRMIFDKSGSLASMTRHDYLPFGEEVWANTGLRATTQGYTAYPNSAVDKARHKFTEQERDIETGMDYMHARYYANAQGRFNSPDSLLGSLQNPQSLNRYAYTLNDPINYSDPTGHLPSYHQYSSYSQSDEGDGWSWDDPNSPETVFESTTGLSIAAETKRSDLMRQGFIQETGWNPWEEDWSSVLAAQPVGNVNVTAEAEVTGATGDPQKTQEAITNAATPDQAALLISGAAEAVSRMQIGQCRDFFGSNGLAAFNNVAWTINSELPSSGHPQAVNGPGTIVQVNPNGGLLTPDGSNRTFNLVDPQNSKNVYRLTLTGVLARAFGEAHEGAHQAHRFGNTDRDDYPKNLLNNYRNNYKIWKACFSEIAPVRWTSGGLPPP